MAINSVASHSLHRANLRRRGGLLGLIERLERFARVAYERRALRNADETTLRDIGVTRAEADHEAARPFWDLPENR